MLPCHNLPALKIRRYRAIICHLSINENNFKPAHGAKIAIIFRHNAKSAKCNSIWLINFKFYYSPISRELRCSPHRSSDACAAAQQNIQTDWSKHLGGFLRQVTLQGDCHPFDSNLQWLLESELWFGVSLSGEVRLFICCYVLTLFFMPRSILVVTARAALNSAINNFQHIFTSCACCSPHSEVENARSLGFA